MELWALVSIGAYLLVKIISYRVYRSLLKKIPFRIHVNGIRGKSQTTELITLGLQAGGIRTIGKITGNIPSLINIDGTKSLIRRITPASIREQEKIVRLGIRKKVEALVIECMAISPEMQWVSEHRMIRSQIGIITNIRTDHTDVLGKSEEEIVRALAVTIPYRGALFTSEIKHRNILAEKAEKRGTTLVYVPPEDKKEQTLEGNIPLWIHSDNLALALAVCRHLNVPDKIALRGMLRSDGDAGRFGIYRVTFNNKCIFFVNAFSANDPVSTRILFDKTLNYIGRKKTVIGIFNHRRDRSFRAGSFSEFVEKSHFQHLILIGNRLNRPFRFFRDTVDLSRIRIAETLWNRLTSELETESIIFGFGNISGIAFDLSRYLRKIGEEI